MITRLSQSQLIAALGDMGTEYSALLLGAGASRSSGVLLAREIVHDIVATEYCHESGIAVDLKSRVPASEVRGWLELQDWFRQARVRGESDYSAVFRQFKPTKDHQIRYISSLLDGSLASRAYHALSRLMRERIFPVVLTTNFDPLLENTYKGKFQSEASLRVIESADGFERVNVEPRRVVLGHLHGNLNGYAIANLDEDTRLLKPEICQALTRLLNPFALVVIGYSGNDQSVMGLLETIAKDASAFKRGVIYWCHTPGSSISARVSELLESVDSGFTVELAGFDQLIQRLSERLNIGTEEFRAERPVELKEPSGASADTAAVNVSLLHSLPKQMLRFRTGLKSKKELDDIRGEHDWWQGTLYENEFWLLGDPDELPKELAESISAEPTPIELNDEALCDAATWRVFVELANKGLEATLRRDVGLRLFRGRRFFFPKPRNKDERKVTYLSRKVKAHRRVVWKAFTRGEGDDETSYYLHESLRTHISRFRGHLCLVIRPTRLFTVFGEEVWDSDSARSSIGRSTSKVWNEPYDSLVRLWLDVLSRESETICIRFSADGRKLEYRMEFQKRPLEALKIGR